MLAAPEHSGLARTACNQPDIVIGGGAGSTSQGFTRRDWTNDDLQTSATARRDLHLRGSAYWAVVSLSIQTTRCRASSRRKIDRINDQHMYNSTASWGLLFRTNV